MDLLSNLLVFVMLYNVLAIVYITHTDRVPWAFLLLALPFYAMYVVRLKIKNTPLFALCHVLLAALPFLLALNTTIEIVLMAVGFMAVAAVLSMYASVKGERRIEFGRAIGVVVLIAAAQIVISIISYRNGIHIYGADLLARLSIILAVTASVAYVQMDNLNANLRVFGTAGATDASVYQVNNKLTVGFSAVMALVAAAAVVFTPLMALIVRFLGFIANLIMRLPMFYIPNQPHGYDLTGYVMTTPGDVFDALVEQGDYTELVEALTQWPWYVLAAILFVFVIVSIALMAMGMGRALANRRRRNEGGDINLTEDELGRLKFSARDLAAFFPRFRINAKHPVRKAYIKKVSGHMKQGVAVEHFHTPEVIADLIREREDIDGLTETYENIRYGRL